MSNYPEMVGDGYAFHHNGKEYHVGLITQELKSKFEKLVWTKEKSKLAEVKDLLSPESYRTRADALAERYLAGGFAMVQSDMKQSPLADPANAFVMMSLMLDVPELEAMTLAGGCPEFLSLVQCAMRDSFPGVAQGEDVEKKSP